MREIVAIAVGDVLPERAAVLAGLGFRTGDAPDARMEALLERGFALLAAHARPAGVVADVDRDAFGAIYRGEGRNAAETPLAGIFPRADHLALYAVTLGHDVGRMIGELFAAREFAVGSVLDAAASEATERAGDAVERRFAERTAGASRAGTAVLRYSPGYCGWDMTGQRALFAALRPDGIGIALRESCLMEPLKSMSGVIVAGEAAIHEFDDAYEFCADCRTRGCRDRIRRAVVT